jgi:hypothetical protein
VNQWLRVSKQRFKAGKGFFGQMICLLTILFTSYHSIFRFTEITLVCFRFWHRLQFSYMKMTTGDQQMAQPQQEGMPDMAKMMKS